MLDSSSCFASKSGVLLGLVLVVGCSSSRTDLAKPEPASDAPAASDASANEETPEGTSATPVSATDIEQNQADLQRMREIADQIELEVTGYVSDIDAVAQAADELAVIAKETRLSQPAVDRMATRAVRKGQVEVPERVPEARRGDVRQALQTLADGAPVVTSAAATVAMKQERIDALAAEAEQLHATMRGRTRAYASGPTTPPAIMEDLERLETLHVETLANAEAADETLDAALMRAKALAQTLAVEVTGPATPRADVDRAAEVGETPSTESAPAP